MITEELFITEKKWEHPKYPPIDEWVNKMWYIHTIKYCLAIKRKKVLIHATRQANLKNIMVTESQTQNAACCMTPFI